MGESDQGIQRSSQQVSRPATCKITGKIKVFCRSLVALSKLSEEVFIEARSEGLAVRARKANDSAYAAILFGTEFFDQYDCGICQAVETNSNASFQSDKADLSHSIKLPMKCALLVFKSPIFFEKNVEACILTIDSNADKLLVEMNLKNGLLKHYKVPLMDFEGGMRPTYDKRQLGNIVVSNPKLILDAFNNFGSSTDEVTFKVKADDRRGQLMLTNYVESMPGRNQVVKTEVTIPAGDFERFSVSADAEATVSLKELKAFTAFAEAFSLIVTLYFDAAPKPLFCSIESEVDFSADLTLGTLIVDEVVDNNIDRLESVIAATDLISTDSLLAAEKARESSHNTHLERNQSEEVTAKRCLIGGQSFTSQPIYAPDLDSEQRGSQPLRKKSQNAAADGHMDGDQQVGQEVIFVENRSIDLNRQPPVKKFRRHFLALSQSTMNMSDIIDNAETIAPDTE